MQFTQGPVLTLNPNPAAPLAAILEFATDMPAVATVEVDDGVRRWTLPEAAAATEHRIPVVGLRPGATHRVSVAATGEDGDSITSKGLEVTAPTLADDMPPIEVTTCIPEKREPGAMMFNIRYSPASEHLPGFGLLVAVDRDGEIVWTYRKDEAIGDCRRLQNGNVMYVADGRICEIDLLGNTVGEWYAVERWKDKTPPSGAIPVDVGMFHHAAIELPSGNFLACSMEIREIAGFPATEDDPDGGTETARVVGDVIVEFQRDGTVVRDYKLLDLLDPHRVCYGSRAAYWIRRGYPDTCDWSHVNALAYDPSDDSFVASVRHQDCMIKIDRQSGELVWILGTHANWKAPWADKLLAPADGLDWQFHQHDCTVTGPGRVMCFDNGNFRATPFDPKIEDAKNHSRAVEFAVDADGQTAGQVWAYGDGTDRCYSTYQSGAYRLPATGNTFINYGGVCSIDGVPSTKINEGHCRARLIEVTAGDAPEIVFELIVNDTSPEKPIAWSSFRAEHFPEFGGRA